jgi:LacI family transcriptional regulator
MARRSSTSTITEVAQHAGVSPATVSRVMNGRFAGEPGVAERVRASAAELNYSPSPLARSLALGVTQTIAFVVPDLANPAFQSILSSLSKTAGRDGHRVLVADAAESPDDEPLLAVDVRRRCDAIVLCAPRMAEDRLAEVIAALAPVVLINRASGTPAVPSLAVDYRAGVRELAEHLFALGHRSFAFVEGPPTSVSNSHRLLGLEEFRASCPRVVITRVPGGTGTEDGRTAVDAVLATEATAVLAFNDLVAIGLLGGLAERGVDVPGDLSVTGFDDIPFARYTSPPLTTASVPHEELGEQAWHQLRAMMTGGTPDPDLLVEPRLERRDSTAPPRPR